LLSELVDIHAHVLPGIDDGPASIEQTLALVRAARETGIVCLAATPHLRADFPQVDVHELAQRLELVRSAASAEALKLRLVAGAEVSLSWALSAGEQELRLASYGQAGRDLLIETPPVNTYSIETPLYELRLRGYRITLAHPERTPELQDKPERLRELSERGILLQVNAESLLGSEQSSRVRRTARWLCTEGVAHVLASDAHRGQGWRPIGRLELATQALARLVGPERARWMTSTAPAAVIDGVALAPAPEPVLRRGWLHFGRG
jgi:protein-tyrosine phosphatase